LESPFLEEEERLPYYYLHLFRSPDDSKIKQKMLYASSKDALRKSLVGISSEIQGTDSSEVAHETGELLKARKRIKEG